jgi:hypothetical protein
MIERAGATCLSAFSTTRIQIRLLTALNPPWYRLVSYWSTISSSR